MKVALWGQSAEGKSRLREILKQFEGVEVIEIAPPEEFQGIQIDCVFFEEEGS